MKIYGLVIALAISLAYFILEKELKRRALEIALEKLLIYLFIFGVLGARLWHLLTDFSLYSFLWQEGDYWAALKIWQGGLSILGAILGGILGIYLFARRHQVNFYLLADLVVLVLPLGQALGRLANFYNGELYGLPVGKAQWWTLYIPPAKRLAGFENFAYYQPLFVYESILLLILALILWYLSKKKEQFKLSSGRLFYFYLFAYLLLRFGLDFLRPDKVMLTATLGLNQLLLVIILLLLTIVRLINAQKT